MRLDVYSHGIKVSEIDGGRDKESLIQFCRPMVEMGLEKVRGRGFRQVPLRTYAAATKDRSEFRFHANQLDDLLRHLSHRGYVLGTDLTVVKHVANLDDFPAVEHKWVSPKTPRDRQPGVIEYVLSPGVIKMVCLQTGKGKTFIAMWCTKEIGLRTLFTFKGGYVSRWYDDLDDTFDFEEGELLLVRGAGGMIKLMEMALDGSLAAKCIIITNGTIRDYLKDYEENNGHSDVYPIAPPDFYRMLGIGFRVMDEVHQEFHLNFRQDLYTHTVKSLSLSATMTSSDPFKNRMYDTAYPVMQRNDGGGYHAFISVTCVQYHIREVGLLKFKGGTGGYSHNALEQSFNRHREMKKAYFKMIEYILDVKYIRVREEGQKILIFCASVDWCTELEARLARRHPTLKVARYCQGDSYQDLLDADIGVSTVLSAGTAVDIPNLRVTLMTTAIDSRQSNEQALGRTRVLVDFPDVTPEFIYLCCMDIPQHVTYHEHKKDFFRGKVVAHREVSVPITI